ncbi:MAG: aldolase/citrate lyase family protein [Dehalococcoidia bacterium]
MRENTLKRLWSEGKPTVGAWLSIPDAFSAEIMAHMGFDWLCLDMQHGLIGYGQAVPMLQAISTTEVIPLARVPWNEPAAIMRMLDAGAWGIIVPLINSRADAEAAVAACRYPPAGIRSFGPTRATLYAGGDYAARANDEVLCIIMIETRQALDNLDDILSVPGVDACYIGPADLSFALGLPPRTDSDEPAHVDAVARILATARRHGVVAGIHTGGAAFASRCIEQGFQLVTLTSDITCMARGARQELQALGQAQARPPGTPPTDTEA